MTIEVLAYEIYSKKENTGKVYKQDIRILKKSDDCYRVTTIHHENGKALAEMQPFEYKTVDVAFEEFENRLEVANKSWTGYKVTGSFITDRFKTVSVSPVVSVYPVILAPPILQDQWF